MNTSPSKEGLSDLHRHLDGSLRPATVAELAARLGLAVPEKLAFEKGMGLEAALSRFAFTLSLLQTPEAVRRVAAEMCEDAAAEGVTTLEIRFAPQLHLREGASLESIVDAALQGIDGRAGLLLCGLYGEPPSVLGELVRVAGPRKGVVGIDLAGGPSSEHRYRMKDYALPFHQAADLGLGRTVHAGEGRPSSEMRVAIEALMANRIGHGTTLLDDEDTVELVFSRGVAIEACVTSNVHTGVIGSVEEHPLPAWLDLGIRVSVCADNTLLSSTDVAEELRRVMTIPGMTEAKRRALVENGHAAAFVRG